MNKRGEESIGLTSTSLYSDEIKSHSDPCISSSEPLLEDGRSSVKYRRRFGWKRIFVLLEACRRRLWARNETVERMRPGRRKGSRLCLTIAFCILVLLGIVQLLSLTISLATHILQNGIHSIVKSWGRPGQLGAGLAHWPTDFSQDILPIPCHSHNDYWRTVPLYSAIEVGCVGVEADIWLFDEELYVGHSVASLTPNRTLKNLYIDPLLDILSKQNPETKLIPEQDSRIHGVFDTTPEQSLIFLIDFKTAGATLWPYAHSALEPLRSRKYLTHSNGGEIIYGPITVVGTGNTPFDLVNSDDSNTDHDIFFDAPLRDMYKAGDTSSAKSASSHEKDYSAESTPDQTSQIGGPIAENDVLQSNSKKKRLDQEGQGKSGTSGDNSDVFNVSNSYYASVAFGEAIGQLQDGEFSQHQLDLLRGQIRGAHERGLKARYWDLPFWPISLRNHVWDVLVKEGVDMLNVDDLKGATKRNWDDHHGWWKRMKGSS